MYTNFNLNFYKLLFLGLVLTFTTSCEDDDVTPTITISDLVGSWEATSFVLTNNTDPSESFNWIENGGTINFTLLSNGGVRTWITIDTFYDEWDSKLTITGNTGITVPVETSRGESTMTFVLENGLIKMLEMTNVDDSFDFTFMGEPEVSTTSVGHFVLK